MKLDASLLLELLQAHRGKFDSSGELNQLRNRVFEGLSSEGGGAGRLLFSHRADGWGQNTL